MRKALGLLASLLLLAGCSSGPAPQAVDRAGSGAPVASASGAPEETGPSKDPGEKGTGRSVKGGKKQAADGPAEIAEAPGKDRSPGSSDASARRGDRRPPAGNFTMSQSGWEEFCQGGVCERERLPSSLSVAIAHGEGGAFQTRSEGGSTVQTIDYRLSDRDLLIERIATSSSYRGFSYETVVAPQPAITSLRLPMRPGTSWSGKWKNRGDGPDGTYGGKVLKAVSAPQRGGETAYLVELKLFFSGEMQGFTTLRATVAKKDLMVLEVQGKTEAQTRFGTYRSEYGSEYRG